MAILRLKQADGTWAEVPALKGDPGPAGSDGKPGKDGADGYTPVRGTDYWTDADKAEIKGYVDEAVKDIDIPTADPYELPVASADTLGGVKVGAGLTVDEAGVLSTEHEGNWETIKQIKTSEEVSTIVVPVDGYKLVKISVDNPGDGASGAGLICCNDTAYYYIGNMSAGARQIHAIVEEKGGAIFGVMAAEGGPGEASLSYMTASIYPRAIKGMQGKHIESVDVRMLGGNTFPVNTIVTVEGVRTNA